MSRYQEESLRTAGCPIQDESEVSSQLLHHQVEVEYFIQGDSIRAMHYMAIFRLTGTLSSQPSPAGLSSILIGESGAVSLLGRRR